MAELDHLSVHPAWLLSDVLPFPPGDVAVSCAPASCRIRRTALITRHRRMRRLWPSLSGSRRDDGDLRNFQAEQIADVRRLHHRGADRHYSDCACRRLLRGTAARDRAVAHRARRAFVRVAAGADGVRHADLDRARAFGPRLFVHPFRRRSEDGRAEIVHQPRPFRDHGDSVLHSRRQSADDRRRRPAHDRLRRLR